LPLFSTSPADRPVGAADYEQDGSFGESLAVGVRGEVVEGSGESSQ
jgi:hypothetical protein